jgi:hypothetical protein
MSHCLQAVGWLLGDSRPLDGGVMMIRGEIRGSESRNVSGDKSGKGRSIAGSWDRIYLSFFVHFQFRFSHESSIPVKHSPRRRFLNRSLSFKTASSSRLLPRRCFKAVVN